MDPVHRGRATIAHDPLEAALTSAQCRADADLAIRFAYALRAAGWFPHQHHVSIARFEPASTPVHGPLDKDTCDALARCQAIADEIAGAPPTRPILRDFDWPRGPDGISLRLQWSSPERPSERSTTRTEGLPPEKRASIWRAIVTEVASAWARADRVGRSSGRVFLGPKDRFLFWPRDANALLAHIPAVMGRLLDLFDVFARAGIKIDLKAAYRALGLDEEDALYHGAIVDATWIIFSRLSFGMSQSPVMFCTALATTIARFRSAMPAVNTAMSSWVDDMALTSLTTSSTVTSAEQLLLALRADLWWIAIGKCWLWPARRLAYIGFILDLDARTVRVDPQKAAKALAFMRDVHRPTDEAIAAANPAAPPLDAAASAAEPSASAAGRALDPVASSDGAAPVSVDVATTDWWHPSVTLPDTLRPPSAGKQPSADLPPQLGSRMELAAEEHHAITKVIGYLAWFQCAIPFVAPWRALLSTLARDGRWTPRAAAGFDAVYQLLQLIPSWQHAVDLAVNELLIVTDASATGWGAVLMKPNGELLRFAGILTPAQVAQSSTVREAAAAAAAIRAAMSLGIAFDAVHVMVDSATLCGSARGHVRSPDVAAQMCIFAAWAACGLRVRFSWQSRDEPSHAAPDALSSAASTARPWPLSAAVLDELLSDVGGQIHVDACAYAGQDSSIAPAYATPSCDTPEQRRIVLEALPPVPPTGPLRPSAAARGGWVGVTASLRIRPGEVAFALPLRSHLRLVLQWWRHSGQPPLLLVAPAVSRRTASTWWGGLLGQIADAAAFSRPLPPASTVPPVAGATADPHPLRAYALGFATMPGCHRGSRLGSPAATAWVRGGRNPGDGPGDESPTTVRRLRLAYVLAGHAPLTATLRTPTPALRTAATALPPTSARLATVPSGTSSRTGVMTHATAAAAAAPAATTLPATRRLSVAASTPDPRTLPAAARLAAALGAGSSVPTVRTATAHDRALQVPARPDAPRVPGQSACTTAPSASAPPSHVSLPVGAITMDAAIVQALRAHGGLPMHPVAAAAGGAGAVAPAHLPAIHSAATLSTRKALMGSSAPVRLLELCRGFAIHRAVSHHPWSAEQAEAFVLDLTTARIDGKALPIQGWSACKAPAALADASRIAAAFRRSGFIMAPFCGAAVKSLCVARGAKDVPEHSAAYPLHLALLLATEPAAAHPDRVAWEALVLMSLFALRTGIIYHVWSHMFIPYDGGFIFVWRHTHKRTASIADANDLDALSKIGSVTGARNPVLQTIIRRGAPNHRLFPSLTADDLTAFVRRCVPGIHPGFDIRSYGTRASADHDATMLHLPDPVTNRIFWWKPKEKQMRTYYSSQVICESYVFSERRAAITFHHVLPGTADARIPTVALRNWANVGVGTTLPPAPPLSAIKEALACIAPSVGVGRALRADVRAKRARTAAGELSTESESGQAPVTSGPCTICCTHVSHDEDAACCVRCPRIACSACHPDLEADWHCPVHRQPRRRTGPAKRAAG